MQEDRFQRNELWIACICFGIVAVAALTLIGMFGIT